MKTLVLLSHFKETQEWVIALLKDKGVQEIAIIIDAKKPRLEKDKNYVFVEKKVFEDAGLRVRFVDLEILSGKNLESAFDGVGAIYVKGGNSFYLLHAMRSSGIDKLIGGILDRGVIYIGESAGAYVACPTIEMAHWKHQDKDIVGIDDLTSLSLVPYLISAHYEEALLPLIQPYISESNFEVKLLRDNELILVEDENSKIIAL